MRKADNLWTRAKYEDIHPLSWWALEEFTEELLLKMALPTHVRKVWALLYWRPQ